MCHTATADRVPKGIERRAIGDQSGWMTGRMTTAMAVMALLALASRVDAQAVCGNNVLEPPELCDDGNVVDGDGCDSNCTPTGCGNGVVTAGEQCDDGNVVSGDCCSATCVLENLPPDCSGAAPSIGDLWPPNHKSVPIAITGVTDPDGDPLVLTVTAIAQDEPIDASGSGNTCPDATGVGVDTASVRSERSGNGDGRVYHIAFQAVDRCNAACIGEVTVCVRHDHRPNGVCGDGGPLFDATAGVPPCNGASCGPEDCVPDPGDVDECDHDTVPEAVTIRFARAQKLLARSSGHGKGGKVGRAAAKQLAKAGKRAERAARNGDLSDGCATALAGVLDGATTCVACRGED
jgi:cysteine-rich repeat protein